MIHENKIEDYLMFLGINFKYHLLILGLIPYRAAFDEPIVESPPALIV